jgi:hypothetical protein
MNDAGANGADMPAAASAAKPEWQAETTRSARPTLPASANAKPIRPRIKTSLTESPGAVLRDDYPHRPVVNRVFRNRYVEKALWPKKRPTLPWNDRFSIRAMPTIRSCGFVDDVARIYLLRAGMNEFKLPPI